MKLTVCVGSACHLKGAPAVMEEFQSVIAEKNLSEKVQLAASFCTGHCQEDGVCVSLDGEYFSVKPGTAADFFETNVVSKL